MKAGRKCGSEDVAHGWDATKQAMNDGGTGGASSPSGGAANRLYGYLLRRALGPFLAPESAALLAHRIDLWNEEKSIELKDVMLQPEAIESRIFQGEPGGDNSRNNITVHRATVRRLAIQLHFRDGDDQGERIGTTFSLIRIFRSSKSVSLVARVEIEGIDITIKPGGHNDEWLTNHSIAADDVPIEEEEGGGFFSSMVASLARSLKLSINVSDVNIQVLSRPDDPSKVQFLLHRFRYDDSVVATRKSQPKRRKIETNDIDVNKAYNGNQAVEYDWRGIEISSSYCGVNQVVLRSQAPGSAKFSVHGKQREISVDAGQYNLELDTALVTRISRIVGYFVDPSLDAGDFVDACDDNECVASPQQECSDRAFVPDEFDRETYEQIMKQYITARHLERTQELRGGLLVPSGADDIENLRDMEFDAFFDANSHSLYDSMVDDDKDDMIEPAEECDVRIDFKLHQLVAKISLDTTTAALGDRQFVVMSLCGLSVTHLDSEGGTSTSSRVSHFEVEQQSEDVSRLLLYFPSHGGIAESSGLDVLSVQIEQAGAEDVEGYCAIECQPLEIVYQHEVIRTLADFVECLPSGRNGSDQIDDEYSGRSELNLSLSCSNLTLFAPAPGSVSYPAHLFDRHGYVDLYYLHSSGETAGLGVEFDGVKVAFGNNPASLLCNSATFFARGTALESRRRRMATIISRRADFATLSGDEETPTHSLSLTFSKSTQTSAAFPMVLPLSKVNQEVDESSVEDDGDDDGHVGIEDQIPGSDPQFILSSKAAKAQAEITLNAPCFTIDVTDAEREAIEKLVSQLFPKDDSDILDENQDGTPTPNKVFGLALNVSQVTTVLHKTKQESTVNSFGILLDDVRVYCLIGANGAEGARVCTQDLTLFEVTNSSTRRASPDTARERSQSLQWRFAKASNTQGRAVLFRQKLSASMSPDTPCVHIDLLLQSDAAAAIHVNVYDMTYRHAISSRWIENLSSLMKGTSQESNRTANEKIEGTIGVFVKIADVNIDYTSPQTFLTPSRSIARFGEVRVSCNLATPSPTVQAFKVAMSDVRLLLCNTRYTNNHENVRLSMAQRFLHDKDLVAEEQGTEDSLSKHFVNLIQLDTFQASILTSNQPGDPGTRVNCFWGKISVLACRDSFSCFLDSINDYIIHASVLTEEQVRVLRESPASSDRNRLKTPQSDVKQSDVDRMQSEHPSPKFNVRSKSRQQSHPQDEAAPGICRTDHSHREMLLFHEDYYSLNTKSKASNTREVHPVRVTEEDSLSLESVCSSQNEWKQVEHGFSSNCPHDDDNFAEWIVCVDDSDKGGDSSDSNLNHSDEEFKIYHDYITPSRQINNVASAEKAESTRHPPTCSLLVKEGSILIRLFDGADFFGKPQLAKKKVIDVSDRRKQQLLGELVGEDNTSSALAPLPEQRHELLQKELSRRKARRNTKKFVSICIDGLRVSKDSFAEGSRLASCTKLRVTDFYVVETISDEDSPLKMIGEWVSDLEHPRDLDEGVVELTLVTRLPRVRISSDGKLMSDECKGVLSLLPLRCNLNQEALRFVRDMFSSDCPAGQEGNEQDIDSEVVTQDVIDIFFERFHVKPCKLKVDYTPVQCDVDALFAERSYIEILNVCSLDGMVLKLVAQLWHIWSLFTSPVVFFT